MRARDLLCSVLFALLCFSATAGNVPFSIGEKPLSDSTNKARSVYAEVGGPSSFYSVNYDTRFSDFKGWGIRVGAGFLPQREQRIFSIPVQLNHLLGKDRHFLESGAGATFYHTNTAGSIWGVDSNKGGSIFGTLSVGYRYQPRVKGLLGRVGATALFGPFLPGIIPHISLGYRF